MPDLSYPATLPGPVAWRHKRYESREMRNLREPANANRLRFRDYGAEAQVEWVYTPAQMAIWKAWCEGALATQLARLRWFSAPLPGRGGPFVVRVARYMAPPRRTHFAVGYWRVSAVLCVRGNTVIPQQDIAVTDPGGFELREDGTRELREDSTNELRG